MAEWQELGYLRRRVRRLATALDEIRFASSMLMDGSDPDISEPAREIHLLAVEALKQEEGVGR